jgi:hypothetical protein
MHWKTILVGQLHCQALDAGKAGKLFLPAALNRTLKVRNRDHNDHEHDQGDKQDEPDIHENQLHEQRITSSPAKRAAAILGDLSIDEDAVHAGKAMDDDTRQPQKGIGQDRLRSIEAELSRTRAGTIYREGSSDDADAEADGSASASDEEDEEDADIREEAETVGQSGQEQLLLDGQSLCPSRIAIDGLIYIRCALSSKIKCSDSKACRRHAQTRRCGYQRGLACSIPY